MDNFFSKSWSKVWQFRQSAVSLHHQTIKNKINAMKKLTYRVLNSWKKQHGLHVASRMFTAAMESGEWTFPQNVVFEYDANTTYVMYEKPEKGTYNTVSLLSKI